MIFHIKQSICTLPDVELNTFGKALNTALDKHHFIEYDYSVEKWLHDVMLTNNYFSKIDLEVLLEDCNMWDKPDGISSANLTLFYVGNGENDTISPKDMLKIVQERSVVVVENADNDWCAIKRWVKLYSKDRTIKSIAEKVHRAITSDLIRPDSNGGGNGTILNCIDRNIQYFLALSKYKITSIFDSDKNSINDSTEHNKVLREGLIARGIEYHELLKREIENYFPLTTYERAKLVTDSVPLASLNMHEWDYLDVYESPLYKKCFNIEKKDVPKLCMELTKDELSERLSSNPPQNDYNEVQRIILLLAKYI